MIKFTNGLVLDKDFNIIKEDVFVDGDSIEKFAGAGAIKQYLAK